MKSPLVRVCLLCNDENGVFAGTCEGISIHRGNLYAEFDFTGVRPPRLTLADDHFRLFRRSFPYSQRRYGVGNWCWDGFTMLPGDAAVLLNRAMLTRQFSASGGCGAEATAIADVFELGPGAALGRIVAAVNALASVR